MDFLKKYFPVAFKAKDLAAFIVSLIIFVVIDVVCGLVIGLLDYAFSSAIVGLSLII